MRWANALRRSGHRVTAPTRAVLSALFAADAPTTAEQIADGLGSRLPALDFTSVDRNLVRVEQLGFVSQVRLGRGPGLYALARDGGSESLGCEQCGRVTAVDSADLDPVRGQWPGRTRTRRGLQGQVTERPGRSPCS